MRIPVSYSLFIQYTNDFSNLVDVFEITSQESQRTQPALFSGQDARLARYQNILSKLSREGETPPTDSASGTADWLLGDDDIVEIQGRPPSIKDEVGGLLVGTFGDINATRL